MSSTVKPLPCRNALVDAPVNGPSTSGLSFHAEPGVGKRFGVGGRLSGCRAVVVGATGAIGSAVTAKFLDEGASVVGGGRSRQKAESLADRERFDFVPVDMESQESVAEFVEQVWSGDGVDVLVHLAATDSQGLALGVTDEEWSRVIEVNLSSTFRLVREMGRRMVDRGLGGRIVLYSSTRSEFAGRAGFAPYGASKAGVNFLVKQLATEWAPHGICVNAVAPGFVLSEITESRASSEFVEMMKRRVPANRLGTAEEMASPAVFLASDDASFMTGQVLFVDGGVTCSS